MRRGRGAALNERRPPRTSDFGFIAIMPDHLRPLRFNPSDSHVLLVFPRTYLGPSTILSFTDHTLQSPPDPASTKFTQQLFQRRDSTLRSHITITVLLINLNLWKTAKHQHLVALNLYRPHCFSVLHSCIATFIAGEETGARFIHSAEYSLGDSDLSSCAFRFHFSE